MTQHWGTRALVDLGGVLRRQGQRSEARKSSGAGWTSPERVGATAPAQLAHEELRAGGARPRRLALTGVDALAGAEHRVADLAAQGLNERQIAPALVVTVATVATHQRHVFNKLEIGSRQELAEQLGGPNEPTRRYDPNPPGPGRESSAPVHCDAPTIAG